MEYMAKYVQVHTHIIEKVHAQMYALDKYYNIYLWCGTFFKENTQPHFRRFPAIFLKNGPCTKQVITFFPEEGGWGQRDSETIKDCASNDV